MKIIAAILMTLFLAGCGGIDHVFTKPEIVDKPPLLLPEPEPAQQIAMEWYIITKDNFEDKVREMEKRGGSVVLFALTGEGYQVLSLNTAELRRYIRQQRAIIAALKQYYERKQLDQK